MRYRAFYYSGGNTDKPGPINIVLTGKGIKLATGMKQFIGYGEITNVAVDYQVVDKEFSAGKAVAGGVLFGGIGALAGGAMGGQKVKSFLKISYLLDSEKRELILQSAVADKLKQQIESKLGMAEKVSKQRPDLLKYHKAFYGASYKGIKKMLGK